MRGAIVLRLFLSLCALLLPGTARAQDGEVVFERTGYRLTSLGATVTASARVLDARRRAVPNAPIAWRIQDSAVATVNNAGQVRSRRVGRTRLWAVSGRDSASALILVDQWASRFAFAPALLRFDAISDRKRVQVVARDASGNPIAGVSPASSCRVVNPRVATLGAGGEITALSSGTTYLRCADRGVADSLRIEVRQRPARAQIMDKGAFASRTASDTFQLRMRAYDATDQEIRDARPTWASLEPRIVSVDPLSGWARAVGIGTVKIVGQVGDMTDTVSISVAAGAGFVAPTIVASDPAATATPAATRAALQMYAPFPAVGDTMALTVNPRNADGAAADPTSVRLRSTDTSVVKLLPGPRVVAQKEGNAYIVGAFAGITDSVPISVRAKGTTLLGEETAVAFVRPTFMDTAVARQRNRAQIDSARRQILAASPIRTGAGRHIAFQGLAAQTALGTQLPNSVIESRTGLLFGGRVTAAPFTKLMLHGDFRTGTLTAEEGASGEDLRLTDAEGQLAFLPASWFAFRVGYTLRALVTPVAKQQWDFASVGLMARPKFIGDRITAVMAGSLIPYGQLRQTDSTATKVEPTSLSGEAGLEFQTGFLNAAITYYVEKMTFPAGNNTTRADRTSMMRLRLGFQFGR